MRAQSLTQNTIPRRPRPVKPEKVKVATGVVPADRPEKAAELRPLIGQRLDFVWGLGAQQIKLTACGLLHAVTDRHVKLLDVAVRYTPSQVQPQHVPQMLLPLSMLVRYSQ